MNQPNLQTIMNGLVNFGKNCYKRDGEYLPEMNRSEAIDAIYAGLSSNGAIVGAYIDPELAATPQLRMEAQVKNIERKERITALKRWCYGDDK